MKKFVVSTVMILGLAAIGFFSVSDALAACNKQDPLFKIERNKNRNVVHYDACLLANGAISAASPIEVYWVMENGSREALNQIEEKFGYGIASIKNRGENEFRIVVKALKDREIVIKKIKGDYQALIRINGELSLLDKVYVQAKDSTLGLPKVAYAEIFGRDLQTNKPVEEKVIPR